MNEKMVALKKRSRRGGAWSSMRVQAVELETAGLVDVDDQHGAEASLRVGHAVPGERGDRNAAVVLDRVDPGEARRERQGQVERIDVERVGIDDEEDVQPGLRGIGDLDEVDAGDGRGRLVADQGLAVGAGHQAVTSTLRNRRSPRARSR